MLRNVSVLAVRFQHPSHHILQVADELLLLVAGDVLAKLLEPKLATLNIGSEQPAERLLAQRKIGFLQHQLLELELERLNQILQIDD